MGNILILKKFVKFIYGNYILRLMNNIQKEKNKSQDKESLLAMVSHDLKNPVNSGIMALKLLQDAKLSPLNTYQTEILESLMFGMKYMQNLIENVLDRYKLENEVYSLEKVPVNFSIFLNTIIEESKYILSDKHQTVKVQNSLKNPNVKIDILELTRAINNLISNAAKYSPAHSEILIKLLEKNSHICMSIENEGCNFNLKNPNEIFDKFVSVSKNQKSLASGLGLYIVKEIIAKHGGEIFVECEPEKFTRFTFILPRK